MNFALPATQSESSDLREVVNAVAELPALAALSELSRWIEILAGREDMPASQRYAQTLELEVAAAPRVQDLSDRYFQWASQDYREAEPIWKTLHGYWDALGSCHEVSLHQMNAGMAGDVPAIFSALCTRVIRSLRHRLQWDLLRYGPLDEGMWQAAGQAYLYACRANMAQRLVEDVDPATPTSAEQEYLCAIGTYISGLENLAPAQIRMALQLIEHFANHFSVTVRAEPVSTHWLDAAQPQPPLRLVRQPVPSDGLRFFSAAAASQAVSAVQDVLQDGVMLTGVRWQVVPRRDELLPVLRHLASLWSIRMPIRNSRRHGMQCGVAVAPGLQPLYDVLTGVEGSDLPLLNWQIQDASLGGVGVTAPSSSSDWLQVGSLVGLQPDGGGWALGVVRRYQRGKDAQGVVGVQTLSTRPVPLAVQGVNTSHAIALDSMDADGSVRVVLGGQRFAPGRVLHGLLGGMPVMLDPIELVERGTDYDIARYRLIPQGE